MSASLHSAVIGTYLQLLPSVAVLLRKAKEHCEATSQDQEALCSAKLAEDMFDFAKQVDQTIRHSRGAVEGVRAGLFAPGGEPVPHDFDALTQKVDEAIAFLKSVPADELDAIADRDMRFEVRSFALDFTVENFLLSFSLPNFYFHLTTAYAILRMKGLPVGKADYLGAIRSNA